MTQLVEPAREVPVRREVDVLICGGGCAGAVAALAAARAGASVALVEQHGFLGGVNTAAQVNGVGGWQFDLDGHPLIAGLPLELMQRITTMGGTPEAVAHLARPVTEPNYRGGGLGCFWVRTHPEHTKLVLDRLMREAGVYLLLHASAVTPVMDGKRVLGAFIESKDGRDAILAKCWPRCWYIRARWRTTRPC